MPHHALCSVFYLMTTTRPVGNQYCFFRGFSYRRKQRLISNFHTNFVMLLFISETSGHSTTTGMNNPYRIVLRKIQHMISRHNSRKSFLMTMPMEFDVP